MIDLRHLALLVAIDDEGSLTAAARAVGVSQPAASQQLRTLERRLGTAVALRTPGGFRLTEAGRVLAGHARQILDSASRAESEIAAIAGLHGGTLRLVSFPSAAATILPRAFVSMREAHPDLGFTLREAETAEALAMLRRGECDLAVIYEWRVDGTADDAPEDVPWTLEPGELALTLVEEEVHLAIPRSHVRAAQARIPLPELRDETWIAGCPVCRAHLLGITRRWGFAPHLGFETDDYVALLRLVGAGLGVALVTDLMLDAARPEDTVALRPVSPVVTRVVKAVASEALLKVPGVRETLAALAEAGATIAAAQRAQVTAQRARVAAR
ncbi:HTH-type transcriptional regulator GltC [Demequina sediminis]|uniref:HTH-type transcriptional regulator GltC n=1 Tax=Demequina sediminis TaxID=1930058 RepID=A0ABP9WIE8_9MICO